VNPARPVKMPAGCHMGGIDQPGTQNSDSWDANWITLIA